MLEGMKIPVAENILLNELRVLSFLLNTYYDYLESCDGIQRIFV